MSIIRPQTIQVNTTDTELSNWEDEHPMGSTSPRSPIPTFGLLIRDDADEDDFKSERSSSLSTAADANLQNLPEQGQDEETEDNVNENDYDGDLDTINDSKGLCSTSKTSRRRNSDQTPEGYGYWILKYPLLIAISLVIFLELLLYFSIRLFVVAIENGFVWRGRRLELKRKIRAASTYPLWLKYGRELDKIDGRLAWRKEDESSVFDWRLIRRVIRLLKQLRGIQSVRKLKRLLMDGALKSNLGGVENAALYSRCYSGTKHLVDEYVDEVLLSIDTVYESPLLNMDEKRQFFKRAQKSYGRSALCLSGGATFGYYHLGVIKALVEQDALPQVIAGTSAGSLIASFVCVRSIQELKDELNPELHKVFTACDIPWYKFCKNLFSTGAGFEPEHWIPKLHLVTKGDTTFLEAFERTGRILNITVIADEEHSPPKLLNYKTAPDVVIYTAVLASSAVPGILPAMELKRKLPDGSIIPYLEEGRLWRDGSLRIDIPLIQLHQMFRVNYTIVSQVNPHVILFFYEARGSGGRPTAHRKGRGWRGGFLASYMEHSLKLDLIKNIRLLRDLHLLPRPVFRNQDFTAVFLQKFDGSITILPKISISDYIHILADPNSERMSKYLLLGQRNTWPKLQMIMNRMKIELKIAEYNDQISK